MVIQVKAQGFILVRAECPYVQFELSCSYTQMFALGVTNGRERENKGPKSLVRGCVCVCVFECKCMSVYTDVDAPAWGAPPPFIAQGVRVYREGKRESVGVGRLRTPFCY